MPLDPETCHWFTGDGMVHGVRLREGTAEKVRRGGTATAGSAPHRGPRAGLARPRRAPIRTGLGVLGANTNILSHAGRTLALVEAGITNYELTDDLDTVGPCELGGTLRGGYTAHPKHDQDTGELHAVSYSFGHGNRVQYSVIGVDGGHLRYPAGRRLRATCATERRPGWCFLASLAGSGCPTRSSP